MVVDWSSLIIFKSPFHAVGGKNNGGSFTVVEPIATGFSYSTTTTSGNPIIESFESMFEDDYNFPFLTSAGTGGFWAVSAIRLRRGGAGARASRDAVRDFALALFLEEESILCGKRCLLFP